LDDEDDAYAPIAYLAAPNAEPTQHLEIAEREKMAGEGLGRALATLDPRSRHIVESRWLDDENPATLHELAAVYGISAERVRQIEAKALQKLKGALVA
jgi:RNA polymerase sigma-32 factor